MADLNPSPTPAPPAPDPEPASTTSDRDLVPGAESSDPTVHRLLALRDIATWNKETDTYDRITAELAELGWK